jgi:hypothetical protein
MLCVSKRVHGFRVAVPTLLLLAVIPTVCSAADADDKPKRQWGEPLNDQAVSIATPKDKYSPGEKIALDIACKNVSKKDVNTRLASAFGTYFIHISHDGKDVPPTPYGEKTFDAAQGGGVSTYPLHPGEQVSICIYLNKLFDLSKPGRYVITAKKAIRTSDRISKKNLAISNKITVTVEDRPAVSEEIGLDFDNWQFPKR